MTESRDWSAPSPADGPTTPGRPAPTERPTEPATPQLPIRDGAAASRPRIRPGRAAPGRTRISGTLVGIVLGAVVLVFLLVFVLQNMQPVTVSFLWLEGTLPLGVWLLFAAIAGLLLLAVPGLGRLVQWRRASEQRRGRMVR